MNETQITVLRNLLSQKIQSAFDLSEKLAQEETKDSDSGEIRAQKAVAQYKSSQLLNENLQQQKKIQKIIDAKIVPGKLYLDGGKLPSRVKYFKKDLLQLGTSSEGFVWVRNICCIYQEDDGEWKYICNNKNTCIFCEMMPKSIQEEIMQETLAILK